MGRMLGARVCLPIAEVGLVECLRLFGLASVAFGEPEDLPDLDVQRPGDALLRSEAGTASASFEVGHVRRLEVSGIG